MIRLLFFLRFRSQLRRTNPEWVNALEDRVLEIIRDAGGAEKVERRLLSGAFDESSLGVWLDILICIEGILGELERHSGDLFGYALVIGKDIPEDGAERLCRRFSSPRSTPGETGGVYCDGKLRESLSYYLRFDADAGTSGEAPPGEGGDFARVNAINSLGGLRSPVPVEAEQTRCGNIVGSLKQGKRKNVLIVGPEFSGKRRALYQFCAGKTAAVGAGAGGKAAPPLVLRFGSGRAGWGLAAISDAYSPDLREFLTAGDGAPEKTVLDELDVLQGSLLRDRLHGEVPLLLLRIGRRFFKLLLDTYVAAVHARSLPCAVILEDIDVAPESAAGIVQEALRAQAHLPVYGTALPAPVDLKSWERFFPRIIRLEGEGTDYDPDMSRDLWEIAYAFALLGRFFPGPLLPRLLTEGGKSPAVISRALDMLIRAGLVDSPHDPRPRIRDFLPKAERVLGERKDLVRGIVRNRLLDWVFNNRMRPCFALLEALVSLGGGAKIFSSIKRGDELILKSVITDLTNDTSSGMEEAMGKGRLNAVVGPERGFTVVHIIKTFKALLSGDADVIREVFRKPLGEDRIYPPYRAQVLVNAAAYQLGNRDFDSAQSTIKEAFVLSQSAPWSGLAQSNRLFSLVNLAKQRIGETVDYSGFAVENAEKSGNYEELGVASYYAAAVQTLFGNLAQAERLGAMAESQAAHAGRAEWADRARFLRGKLAFDLGRYQDALQQFQDIAGNPAGNLSAEKLSLLEAWAYRARVYAQNPLSPKPPTGGLDADFFEIEAAYLAEDYPRTVDLALKLDESLSREYFIFTEQPDWRSGFAQCELLLLSPKEFWDRMISVYLSLALSHISPDGRKEALRIMERIMREERLPEMDPWDAFYFYAWYRVLEESGAAQVDMNTAVSMAFKRLQRRASRIDDPKIRQAYLTQPRWNGALSLAAKEHMLI